MKRRFSFTRVALSTGTRVRKANADQSAKQRFTSELAGSNKENR
jgi:hypothetical protein